MSYTESNGGLYAHPTLANANAAFDAARAPTADELGGRWYTIGEAVDHEFDSRLDYGFYSPDGRVAVPNRPGSYYDALDFNDAPGRPIIAMPSHRLTPAFFPFSAEMRDPRARRDRRRHRRISE